MTLDRFLSLSLCSLLVLSLPANAEVKQPSVPEAVAEAVKRLDVAQPKEARKALDPVASKASENASLALAMGRLLEMEKKTDEALGLAKKARELSPSDPEAAAVLGEMLLRANKGGEADDAFKKAEELSTKILEGDAKNSSARLSLAIAQQRLKKFEDAEKTLAKLREDEPANVQALYRTGINYVLQQKWPEAVDFFTKSIEKDGGWAYAYYYRALSQEKLGKKDQLVNDMNRFLKLAPDAPEASRAKQIVQAAKR
ncbi:MAG: tetratricopeptide repeat protein [Thermoanaerobaculia bacterium]|nr:tetratricopeptide repeat protein [Thermoanaerobaculia bacterium]